MALSFLLPCPAVPFSKAWGIASGCGQPLGSHFYTAQQDSVRWWDFIIRSYTSNLRTINRVQPASLTSCAYYSTFVLNCQGLFLIFLSLGVAECPSRMGLLGLSSDQLPYSVVIIPLCSLVVKNFFNFFTDLLSAGSELLMWVGCFQIT
jgi:hypothetical protein